MGLLFVGLASISLVPIRFFFLENPWVSVFNILGFFFLVSLPVTIFFFPSDFSSIFFFWLFFGP